MNIETKGINNASKTAQQTIKTQQDQESSVKFSDELKELEAEQKLETKDENIRASEAKNAEAETNKTKEEKNNSNKNTDLAPNKIETNINPKKIKVSTAIDDLNKMFSEINQLDEKNSENVKKDNIFTDNNDMINNDINIENKDLLPQMNPSMNFNSNGQPFSSFMNEEAQNSTNKTLGTNVSDLAEEAAILSTMAENIAIANKNTLIKQPEQAEKTVINNEGVKKVDIKTGITTENIVKFDSVVMNEADVEVFTQLVQNGSVDMKNLAPQTAERSVQVSKTLADMLAKSMETGQPLRIDFDNNISVIIRISRDGKITADFLPSSQVAEAYLKENLPLLRQKFDNENIKYDELNQRERREHQKEQNRKKGRNDE